MSEVSIFGAGAFGTALAISLANDGHSVDLVARTQDHANAMGKDRTNATRLPGVRFPKNLKILGTCPDPALICLLVVPTQQLAGFLHANRQAFIGRTLVACCKGVDVKTGLGPTDIIAKNCPTSEAAVLSGPSFAVDIAAGLPTALTIASQSEKTAQYLQSVLSTRTLRLYRSTDTTGVQLGGALKNVMAIASGIAIGAGLGESARAALMTRGYEELRRFSRSAGAGAETLAGLSGLGDLVLTCTSSKSRNFVHGCTLGKAETPDESVTVEGVSTAIAVTELAKSRDIDMPITFAVAALVSGQITVREAIDMLLERPLKKE
ncbi:MAG: NAD(P)H-dependent glycerol-3-phosphate dehydrogenase [Paracoccaceae bacterium]